MIRAIVFILFCLLSYTCFCQDATLHFITEQKAIAIAEKHGLHPKVIKNEFEGLEGIRAKLDTANKFWEIELNKRTYRKWGKTTRQYPSDRCKPCKSVNGCYVSRACIIWISAVTGKVIKKKKEMTVSGCYE